MIWGLWALVSPVFVALAMAVVNRVSWTRGRPADDPSGVTVCIPARDEAATIEAVVGAALASAAVAVWVCDDGSTDGTSKILARLAEQHDRLHILTAPPLPAGWVGKVRACHLLSQAATTPLLVFVDADTTLRPGGLARVVGLLDHYTAGIVTAVPRQELGTWLERWVIPLLHLTYVSWLPLALVWRSNNPSVLAANGQILGVRRDVLDDIGGFAAIRRELVDDMALCRRAKQRGHRVVFADGHDIATCRMYRSAPAVWQGFSKNIFEGLGGSLGALVAVSALYLCAFVLPYALLVASVSAPALLPVALTSVLANVALRSLLAQRHGHPLVSVLVHPLAVVVLVTIAWNSMLWSRRGQIRWAGRVYPGLRGPE